MSTLRLTSSGSGLGSSSSSSSLLVLFEHDVNVSVREKIDCFKLLRVIIKNLCDPIKVCESKYRQLKLNNIKIQSLIRHKCIIQYLQSVIGFKETTSTDDGTAILEVDNVSLDTGVVAAAYTSVSAALERIEALVPKDSTTVITTKKPTLQHSASTVSTDSIVSTTSSSNGYNNNNNSDTDISSLSEKQRARLLKERQVAIEREQDKLARKRTANQIQLDKLVRQNDPNWQPSVSAAANKNGSSMQTFRDKFGEN